MKSLESFLTELGRIDIKVRLVDGKLKINAPRDALTVEIKTELKERKDELLELLRRRARPDAFAELIPTHVGRTRYPLSLAQQRLWFIDRLEPGNAAYNIPYALRLQGRLKVKLLEETLALVRNRHLVLCARFEQNENGEPSQVLDPQARFPMEFDDISNHADPMAEALRLGGEETMRPFDLEGGPPMRARLLRLAERDHVLLLTLHHIVADGWSLGLLVRETAAIYRALAAESPEEPALPPADLQYGDFSVWQRGWLQGEELARQQRFWEGHLSGAPQLLQMPTDRPRPRVQSFRGALVRFEIDAETATAADRFARAADTTPFVVLQAAFALLLHHYSAQDDVLVGAPNANRNRPEIESLIGFFVNTLVYRYRFGGGIRTFADLVERARRDALDAQAHQDIPFEQIVDRLGVDRDLSHAPLYQVTFSLERFEATELALPDLTLSAIAPEHPTAKFDMSLSLIEAPEAAATLAGGIEYNTDLFDRESVALFAERYMHLVGSVLADPNLPLRRLSLAVPAAAIPEPPALEGSAPFNPCPQRIAAHAERDPCAGAVRGPSGEDGTLVSLDFGALNRRARILAGRLRALGVAAEKVVAVWGVPEPGTVVAMLAVLHAGGTYLPLDPELPGSRIAHMLADSDAVALLRPVGADLPDGFDPPVSIAYRPDGRLAEKGPPEPPSPEVAIDPDRLAYVVYTSGSTGQPKAVMCHHGGLSRLIDWYGGFGGLEPGVRVLQFANFGFDASVLDLWCPLALGANVAMVPEEIRMDPPALRDWIVRESVHVGFLTSSLAEALMDQAWPDEAPFRLLFTGAERLNRYPSSKLPFQLVNLYGPTENSALSTACRLPRDWDRLPPIGTANPFTLTYVTGPHLTVRSLGLPGELCLGGQGLARGYLGRPSQTAEKFIPDLFSGTRGGRLYRSGDLVRWILDHRHKPTLAFLGRIDHQIKIRGFRIELGEIETALATLSGVAEAAVLPVEKRSGGLRLCAFAAPAGLDPQRLREDLANGLPAYMVPSTIIALQSLPRTASGKIDRPALARMPVDEDAGTEKVLPRNGLERTIAGVWAEVLSLETVGVHDNFFDLGGHSLMAAGVISRLKRHGFSLPLRALFETPTVAGLARTIERGNANQRSEPPPIAPVPAADRAKLPLSFAQERLWFLDQLEGPNSAYNIPAAFHLRGPLDPDLLSRAFAAMVDRHESLRTRIETRDGEPRQVIETRVEAAVGFADLSDLEDPLAEASGRAATHATRAFHIDRAPLMRLDLLRLAPEHHALLVNMHHIVSDGWSIGVFLREMVAFYEAFAAGVEAGLAEPALQYADFAVWQRQWLQGEALASKIAFWREHLQGAPLLDLPADRPRGPVAGFEDGHAVLQIDAGLTRALNALSREHECSVFMTLFGAFNLLLAKLAGQDDVVTGIPVAGRHHPGTEDLIGFFINNLPVRIRLNPEPGNAALRFSELLDRVRTATLAAQEHQDIPFARLVEELAPQRDLSRNPLFQVFFNMINLPLRGGSPKRLRFEPLGDIDVGAKFDMTLYMSENPDGLHGYLHYNGGLFDHGRMTLFLDQFHHLLAQAAAAPEMPVSEMDLHTPGTAAILPDVTRVPDALWRGSVPAQFNRMAERDPQRDALIGDGQSLSYGRLAAWFQGISAALAKRGVGKGDIVAVLGARRPELVPAILGVMKTGAAFTVLDPAYPAARLAEYLEALQPKGWLALGEAGAVPETLEPHVAGADVRLTLSADPEDDDWLEWETAPPPVESGPDDLAYISFTSGTTGMPKGVMGRHGPLTYFTPWIAEQFQIRENDRFSMLSGIAHDPLQRDIFTPLCLGAAICVPNADAILPGTLADWMDANRVSVAHLTPAMSQILADVPEERLLPHLRRVFLTGDMLTAGDADRLQTLAPQAEVVNFYGTTETQRSVAYYRVPRNPVSARHGRQVLPLGRGMPGTQLLVLTPAGKLAAPGELGEIYLRGPHLAAGYWQDPELSDARFLKSPFSDNPRDRLYRTGDLGRYRHDGNAEFAGRADRQLKIRGYRVEPKEIEAVLAGMPGIRNAVVLGREGTSPGSIQIVAYIVADGKDAPPFESLRDACRERLPEFMTPNAFVAIPKVPLTPNGKLDRAALPTPEPAAQTHVPPRNRSERVLARIWAEALGRSEIGIRDNFFELGGHSLIAVKIVARANRELDASIALRDLFQAPDIERLALRVGNRLARTAPMPAIPAVETDAANRYEPFDLTDVQQAYWLGRKDSFELSGVGTHGYLELVLEGVGPEQLNAAWIRVVERHDMLRAIVREDGLQQVLPETPPYRIAHHEPEDGLPETAEAVSLGLREEMSHQVLDPSRWPLFDIRSVRLDGNRIRLHFSYDLLIGDSWSIRIVFRDWLHAYRHPRRPMPAPGITFRDYIVALRTLRETPAYEAARQFWNARLPHLPPAPALPLAKEPSRIEKPTFVRFEGRLKAREWALLKQRAGSLGVTPSIMLLAAFAEVLRLWSGNPRFTLNLTLFNRLPIHPEIKDVVGDFTSLTLLQAEPGPCFGDRAKQLQQTLWEHMEHALVSGVQVLRELSRLRNARVLMPVVFTSVLTQENIPGQETGLETPEPNEDGAGIDESGGYGISQTSQVWLDHQVREVNDRLFYNWDTLAELFPPGLVDQMFAAYKDLLVRLADEPDLLDRDPVVTVPREQLARAERLNLETAPLSRDLLHDGFFGQARIRPDAPALIHAGMTCTYGALAALAEAYAMRLYRALASFGPPENGIPAAGSHGAIAPVAVIMEKGWEQVVAVLAILRAGAAYLPIDGHLPDARRAKLLAESGSRVALVQPAFRMPESGDEAPVQIEVNPRPPDGGPETGLPRRDPRDLAYIIFTSGSTGTPKGVAIDHRGAVNTIRDINQRFALTPADRVLGVSSLSFDLSVWDIFGTLAAGGTLVLPQPARVPDPTDWADLAADHRVTIWNSVPAIVGLYLDLLDEREPAANAHPRNHAPLRLVMMSGDWIPLALPGRLRKRFPAAALISMGGATEASIWSIIYHIEQIDPSWGSVPYGKPMVNQSWRILDDRLRDRPDHVPGELHIGGAGLAMGYWRDPQKTAERFITEPHTGERLYKTGDLGCRLPDGNIEFLGRIDFQVKVGGHRVELGEIEATLLRHESVKEAVVTAHGPRETKSLAAYIVPHTSEATPPAASDGDPLRRAAFKLEQRDRRDASNAPEGLALPAGTEPVRETYLARQSFRRFTGEPIAQDRLAGWLACLRPLRVAGTSLPKFRYPSAGSLFPVDPYLLIKPGAVAGIPGGFYRFHPAANRLIPLAGGGKDPVEAAMILTGPENRHVQVGAGFTLFLIGRRDAIEPLYGEHARDFSLIEAGYMGQLLMEEATVHELGFCPIGAVDLDLLREVFRLEPEQEWLHGLAGGPIAPEQLDTWRSEESVSAVDRLTEELRVYLRQQLSEYMVPASFTLLPSLPLSATGKVDRRALPEPGNPERQDKPPYVAPRTPIEESLAEIWSQTLDVDKVGVHDNFFELGGHSFTAVRLMSRVRKVYGREFPLAQLFREPTVARMAALLERGDARLAWSPIVTLKADGKAAPFFCVHPVGGNIVLFEELAKRLDAPFHAIQSHGLVAGQRHIDEIPAMATAYIRAMRRMQPEGPYHVGGYSFGGTVALEIAQQLHRQEAEMGRLIVMDGHLPEVTPIYRIRDEAKLLGELVQDIVRFRGLDLAIDYETLAKRPPEERMAYILEQCKRKGLADEDADAEQWNRMWRVYKTNHEAGTRYKAVPYPGRATFIRTLRQMGAYAVADTSAGWSDLVPELEIIDIDCYHRELMRPPHVAELADVLTDILGQKAKK